MTLAKHFTQMVAVIGLVAVYLRYFHHIVGNKRRQRL
ncbi:hypothetical protein HAL1_09482 [Halomonas sp. HAL1]|nr:hypothetical protein HAL1_09482 [Halomonas sp. HAL1]